MPHVIVKLWPGKTEKQKKESVSVAMDEVKSGDWAKQVYQPDIKANWDKLYKKPGYSM